MGYKIVWFSAPIKLQIKKREIFAFQSDLVDPWLTDTEGRTGFASRCLPRSHHPSGHRFLLLITWSTAHDKHYVLLLPGAPCANASVWVWQLGLGETWEVGDFVAWPPGQPGWPELWPQLVNWDNFRAGSPVDWLYRSFSIYKLKTVPTTTTHKMSWK